MSFICLCVYLLNYLLGQNYFINKLVNPNDFLLPQMSSRFNLIFYYLPLLVDDCPSLRQKFIIIISNSSVSSTLSVNE